MSWSMWHIYGIGFPVHEAKNDRLEAFIRSHEDTLDKISVATGAYSSVTADIIAYLDDAIHRREDEENGIGLFEALAELNTVYSVADVISNIMSYETGVTFTAPSITDDGEDYVLFTAANPWEYNWTEKDLTFEFLLSIMDKDARELGVDVNKDVDLVYAG